MTDDVNGYRQEGFAKFDRNIHNGRRLSAARAYLHPVKHRKNLTIETLAQVTGLQMRGNRCVGVDFVRAGLRRSAVAGEVILCGGAFNSPQLLQLSGIGDPEHLPGLGSTLESSCPGSAPTCKTTSRCTFSTPASSQSRSRPGWRIGTSPGSGPNGCSFSGVGASNYFEAGGFIRSNDEVEWPNLMFTSC